MTHPEVPWSEPAPEEAARYARYEAAADDRYYNVPARSPEMRAEYDRQEENERQIEADHERYVHFHGIHVQDPGIHVQDPGIEHGNCVDSCPYDTPGQAQERAGLRAWVEQQEAAYAAEMEAGA